MDRTKIKDQFGQFGRRREYGADDDRTTSRQMKKSMPTIELPPEEAEIVVSSSLRFTRTELSLSTRSLTMYHE